MDEMMMILIRIAVLALLLMGGVLAKRMDNYLKSELSEQENAALDRLISELTEAAEQLLKKDDRDGSGRLEYVQDALVEAGYDLTSAVQAKIESSVYRINQGGVHA